MCEGAVLMLLGNKLDLVDAHGREVATGEGQRLAEVRVYLDIQITFFSDFFS